MKREYFKIFNMIAFVLFIIIIFTSIGQLHQFGGLDPILCYILISFSLVGILIQFYFINKMLSEE